MMRLIGISLGNRGGDLELCARWDGVEQKAFYYITANGLKVCETPHYEDASAVLSDLFELNQPIKKENMQ